MKSTGLLLLLPKELATHKRLSSMNKTQKHVDGIRCHGRRFHPPEPRSLNEALQTPRPVIGSQNRK